MTEHKITLTLSDEDVRDLRALRGELDGITEAASKICDAILAQLPEPMEQPTYPGAVAVMDCINCGDGAVHVRVMWDRWSGARCYSHPWGWYANPRPLTPAERAERGIPEPGVAIPAEGTPEWDALVKEMCDSWVAVRKGYRGSMDAAAALRVVRDSGSAR